MSCGLFVGPKKDVAAGDAGVVSPGLAKGRVQPSFFNRIFEVSCRLLGFAVLLTMGVAALVIYAAWPAHKVVNSRPIGVHFVSH